MRRLENEEPEQQVVCYWRRHTQHPKSAPERKHENKERKHENRESIPSLSLRSRERERHECPEGLDPDAKPSHTHINST